MSVLRLLAVVLVLASRAEGAVEVERVETAAVSGAGVRAQLRLVLSSWARPVVRSVVAEPNGPARLYVDLPSGARLARSVVPREAVRPPISGLRVGIGDGGVLRVVVELDGPVTYRVTTSRNGRVVTLDLVGSGESKSAMEPPPAPEGPTRARTTEAPGEPPLTRARPRIVLDPGHGGDDPGARGYAVEKNVTLTIARELAVLLRDRLDAEVVLTRTRDQTLALADRTALANRMEADLFVSIHANASPSRRLHGVETYYLNNTGDRATMRLAAMENGIDRLAPKHGSTELRYILSDLVQVGKMDESAALAAAVQRGLVQHLRGTYGAVTDLGVKQGPFYVLVGAYMPCVLVETSFLNHRTEGRRLAGTRYRQAIAEGLANGIVRFLDSQRRARTL